MAFGNKGSKGDYGPSRMIASCWEVDKGNVVANGVLSLKQLKQVLKDYPDEIKDSDEYGKQIHWLMARPKNGKQKSSSPDFYMYLSLDNRGNATAKADKDDDVPF